MSLILVAAAGTAGLYGITRKHLSRLSVEQEADPFNPVVAKKFRGHGVYGDTAEISRIMATPGVFVEEKYGQDLTGVPCRWLIMRNGCAYKTYNLTTNFLRK